MKTFPTQVVDEHTTVSKPEPKNHNTHILKSDWFWYTIQNGYANEMDYLFGDVSVPPLSLSPLLNCVLLLIPFALAVSGQHYKYAECRSTRLVAD